MMPHATRTPEESCTTIVRPSVGALPVSEKPRICLSMKATPFESAT
jgi:hypothetical protein